MFKLACQGQLPGDEFSPPTILVFNVARPHSERRKQELNMEYMQQNLKPQMIQYVKNMHFKMTDFVVLPQMQLRYG